MITAIIFDMDGVIVDSELKWKKDEMAFFQKHIPGWNLDKHGSLTGLSLPEVHKYLKKEYSFSMPLPEFLAFYNDLAIPLYQKKVELLPDCLQFIQYVAEKKYTLAIASSAPREWIDIVVERFGLDEYFSHLISADDVAQHSKPAPDIYLYAAKQINKKPIDCAVIEDATHGITAAQAAGMKCIGLSSTCNTSQDISHADYIANGFTSILNADINALFYR